MNAEDSIPVGIVVERREIDNPWQDYTLAPVAIIPGAPAMETTDEWKELQHGDGWVQDHDLRFTDWRSIPRLECGQRRDGAPQRRHGVDVREHHRRHDDRGIGHRSRR